MEIRYDDDFLKTLKKVPRKIKLKFVERQSWFEKDQFHPLLNNHALRREWEGYRSIDITGDWRAIFKEVNGVFWFAAIGTHNQLYG